MRVINALSGKTTFLEVAGKTRMIGAAGGILGLGSLLVLLLGVPTRTPMVPVLVAVAALFVAAYSMHHTRGVGIVGYPDFCERVRRATEQRGQKVLGSFSPGDSKEQLRVLVQGLRRRDILTLDTSAMAHVHRHAPEVLIVRARLRMAPSSACAFSDASRRAPTDVLWNPFPFWGRCLKRSLDVVVAPLGLLLSLPILLIAIVAIRIDSPGPALFTQTRLGRGGRPFRLYKLRSMTVNSDDRIHREYVAQMMAGTATPRGGMFKLVDDPRVTRVGRFLRRYSLDELPQLWNVIRGDMSLVGPRPPLPGEAELYDDRSWQRLVVKPGVTGLWQVSGRCELSFQEMVDLDIEYWRSWHPALELRILLKSVSVVLVKKGAA